MSYVVLSSKPGIFRTEPGPGLVPVEAWEYHFDGRVRARFVIARLDDEGRVDIIEETPPYGVNRIRTKFLPHHPDLTTARADIEQLTHGPGSARLTPAPL